MRSADVKEAARDYGADLVGIAPVERLDHLPSENHPRNLSPAVRAVVVVGHRILRGAMRGTEEGTCFVSNYYTFGYGWAEDQFLSRTVYELACHLEREGIEATPLLSHRHAADAFRPDYAAFAQAAGLGKVGKGGFFITPEYGHRQRFGAVLVDFPLDGDAPRDADPCGNCQACKDACPLDALGEVEPDSGIFARDGAVCAVCRNGAQPAGEGRSDDVDRYAASCGRACLVALSEKVENRFAQPFRKRSVWTRGFAPGDRPIAPAAVDNGKKEDRA